MHDIFVSITDKTPFEIKSDRICLYDFEDNYYEIDFNGKELVGPRKQLEGMMPDDITRHLAHKYPSRTRFTHLAYDFKSSLEEKCLKNVEIPGRTVLPGILLP